MQSGERFVSWGGRVVGGVGLVSVAAVAVLGLVGPGGDYHPAAYVVCALVGLVLWAVFLRPMVRVEDDRLVLRNALTTVRVPLAAVEQVVVRQFMVVTAGTRRFTSTAVGRSHRQGVRDDQRGDAAGADLVGLSYAAIAEHRLSRLAEDARTRQGVRLHSDDQVALAEQVRREPARVELALLVVLGVALAVTLLA